MVTAVGKVFELLLQAWASKCHLVGVWRYKVH